MEQPDIWGVGVVSQVRIFREISEARPQTSCAPPATHTRPRQAREDSSEKVGSFMVDPRKPQPYAQWSMESGQDNLSGCVGIPARHKSAYRIHQLQYEDDVVRFEKVTRDWKELKQRKKSLEKT